MVIKMQKDNFDLLDLSRQSHVDFHKKIKDQLDKIYIWLDKVEGQNKDEVVLFIEAYLSHLNSGTCKSMYENVINISKTELIDIHKLSELDLLIKQLKDLKEQVKHL